MRRYGKPAKLQKAMLKFPMFKTRVPKTREFEISNFVVPKKYEKSSFGAQKATVCALIPTYKPGFLTLRLVGDFARWNPGIEIFVIDDCTPSGTEGSQMVFKRVAAVSDRVTLLRTPVNTLKAGALNRGLRYIFEERKGKPPDVILTLDDDVVITPSTVKNLVTELMSYDELGAVCSQCRVLNKNKNLLTRLQGLEYLGFNAIRLADEGFFRGPLVMHGMLPAFRAEALRGEGSFSEGHLIEDYEMTARLKSAGWHVKSAQKAPAWTVVPDRLSKLWSERTPWIYGGLTVVG